MRTNHRFCLIFHSCDFQSTSVCPRACAGRNTEGRYWSSWCFRKHTWSLVAAMYLPYQETFEKLEGALPCPQSTDVLWLFTNYLSSWPMTGLNRSSALDCLGPSKTWIASAQSNYSYWLCFHWNASTIFSFSVSRTCFHSFLLGRQLTLQRLRHCVRRTLAPMSQTTSWLRIT